MEFLKTSMRRWPMFGMLLASLILCAPVFANDALPLERSVKAAFLYKFLGYVEWPAGQSGAGPLVIGVAGADDIAGALAQSVQDKLVNGRQVMVRRVADADALAGVHLLFIGAAEAGRLERWLRPAHARSILTVTESEEAARGGIINFVPMDGRIRFDVSLEAAERSNLKLSSRMLSVARLVHRGPP
jgi:hypothetical protein